MCMLPGLQDSMTSFSISEDGQLYSALTSNNTCALLDVGVSQGKAAWEFLLEDDSPRYVYKLTKISRVSRFVEKRLGR